MRKILLALALSCAAGVSAQDDPVLMTIGDREINRSEFEYLYEKNNSGDAIDKKSLGDYLDLFTKFKMKVIEAENMGLDTTQAFRTEFYGYRSQLIRPYLIDKELEDRLYREAYDHLKEDVEISNILFLLPQNASPEDTLRVYQDALRAYDALRDGDFAIVADSLSNDSNIIARNGGYIGYLTGMMVEWPWENAIYTTPVGSVTGPVRVSYGYNISKVLNRRPAVGTVRASHILIPVREGMTGEQRNEAYHKALDIKKRIDAGEDFAAIAKSSSADRSSASKGGDLSWFGVGRMVRPFEDAAFRLDSGEVSDPVQTDFGWHIIKVTGKKGIDPFEIKRAAIQQRMLHDGRNDMVQNSFVDKKKKEYGLKVDEAVLAVVDSVISAAKGNDAELMASVDSLSGMTVIEFRDNRITADKLVAFYALNGKNMSAAQAAELLADLELLRYEDSMLEEKYPEFGHLMSEYHDGMLLFEISNRMVWEKAAKDEAGLAAYFTEHRKDYAWKEKHYKGFVVMCADEETVAEVRRMYKELPADSFFLYVRTELNNDSVQRAFIERGIWTKGENAVVDRLAFKDKKVEIADNGRFPYPVVLGRMLRKYPEEYKDVRGAVTTDYQQYVEDEWVKSLVEKYPVKVNEEVLSSIKEL